MGAGTVIRNDGGKLRDLDLGELERKGWSEAKFQAQVNKLCEANGWLWYHTHRSDRSPAGFPDLIAIRGTRLIVAELKAYDKRGRLNKATPAQKAWLEAFGVMSAALLENVSIHRIEVYEWNPMDWGLIGRTLER